MDKVRPGDSVRMHYTTYGANGCVIETSEQREPIEFVVGSPDVISGINSAVVGMQKDERRRISVSPERAFGYRDVSLQHEAPRLGILDKVSEGDQLAAEINGQKLDLWIRSVSEDQILMDANHPLAGESLIYEIEIVHIHTA